MEIVGCCSWTTVLAPLAGILLFIWLAKRSRRSSGNLPPQIKSPVPFIGCAIKFGENPIKFLLDAYDKHGSVFRFQMMGSSFTYLVGSDAVSTFFSSKNEDLNAEEVYSRLTTPVFGEGVCYDCPHQDFLEQKRIFKSGLTIARFEAYVPLIVEETKDYFAKWGDQGKQNLFEALSELIILTASRCLHGPEIRGILDEHVAQLYNDLDGGFSHEAWLLPGWLPLPSFRTRDKAHKEMKKIFYKAIADRRASIASGTVGHTDMLQTILDATYKDGRGMTDDEIAGMLIGLLMAGQHTSSTTSAWLGFYLAQNKEFQDQCFEEVHERVGDCESLDGLKDCAFLEMCLRETLRLRPPLMTVMRLVKTPQKVLGFDIPVGEQVCVSPSINHRLEKNWKDANTFSPDRFMERLEGEQKFAYVPFGAGRHRCIGESFAYVQIKTIWCTLLQMYEFELVDGYFPEINFRTMIHTPTNPFVHYRRRKTA
ncbi:lanosterol 14-alpha demethylase-like isoform X2 [Sycon ciliatum]|uniref:lanosterol 14-alpha demethylase-like isoform X2 n=1 Tax=Sycon ciliatum TaxID=27933 RepID=UPI0031F61A14